MSINEKIVLSQLRRLEQKHYPKHMLQLQYVKSCDDVAEYCECRKDQLRILVTMDWYLLMAEHDDYVEVCDLAGRLGSDIFSVIKMITDFNKEVVLDARDRTSYPLIRRVCAARGYKVIENEPWLWGAESMHSMRIALK